MPVRGSGNPLTAPSRALLARLLAWDRQRIAAAMLQYGRDFPPYRARQDIAEATLNTRPDSWTNDTRELFQTLIETKWSSDSSARGEHATAAVEIGSDDKLREVQPAMFAATDKDAADTKG